MSFRDIVEQVRVDVNTHRKRLGVPEWKFCPIPEPRYLGKRMQEELRRVEVKYMTKAALMTDGNKKLMAKLLGISYRQLRYRLGKLNGKAQ